MKSKLLVLTAVWTVVLALAGAAAEPTVPYVDLAQAQTLVDTMTKENQTLKADNDKAAAEITTLQDQATTIRKKISDLNLILADVKASNSDSATVAEATVDTGLKAKILAAAAKNKAAQDKVVAKINEFDAQAKELDKKIADDRTLIVINEGKISRNSDNIVFLQASIAKTQAQQGKAEAVIAQIDALSTKLDAALK